MREREKEREGEKESERLNNRKVAMTSKCHSYFLSVFQRLMPNKSDRIQLRLSLVHIRVHVLDIQYYSETMWILEKNEREIKT